MARTLRVCSDSPAIPTEPKLEGNQSRDSKKMSTGWIPVPQPTASVYPERRKVHFVQDRVLGGPANEEPRPSPWNAGNPILRSFMDIARRTSSNSGKDAGKVLDVSQFGDKGKQAPPL